MSEIHHIRFAGRHLLTIGRDLIQNKIAAIIELVKNAYDADASLVTISFIVPSNRNEIVIVVDDNGHGMSKDTVVEKWLVSSTDDKLKRKVSPGGRIMQGRKGIGRYAASVLGPECTLRTKNREGAGTQVKVNWQSFEEAEYTDEVDIVVESFEDDSEVGTMLTVKGSEENLNDWNKKQFSLLKSELRKLLPPALDKNIAELKEDDFEINLELDGWFYNEESPTYITIEPYPIFDLYHYRIAGIIHENGTGTLVYHNQRAKNTPKESIELQLNKNTICGKLAVDIRGFDRENDAIDQLIKFGLKDSEGTYLGNMEAKRLLNKSNGIGVYRNGFRIRPLGDPEFDWLELNRKRIQNPTQKIGSNQVIGYVLIQSEEESGLEETSARHGLKENIQYKALQEITLKIIGELENRRYIYRKKSGLSRTAIKIEKQLEKLYTFEDVKQNIRRRLRKSGIDQKATEEIIDIVTKKEQVNNEITGKIQQLVAVYQGQATLGKIVNVILHEGRRPLNFFNNQISNIIFWVKEFKKSRDVATSDEIVSIVNGYSENTDILVELFSKLDHLATKKRGTKKTFNIKEVAESTHRVFEGVLLSNKIHFSVTSQEDVNFYGWSSDFYIIFTNLIDNSIYWLIEDESKMKSININIVSENGKLIHIDCKDSGTGIAVHLIESEVIFEPDFTTKRQGEGMGLGLAIAGEAATRNNLEIKAYEWDSGAFLRLQPIEEDDNE